MSSSSTPRTVTDCSSSQFEASKVKLAQGTASAPVSPDDTATITEPVGSDASLSVYVAVAPSPTTNSSGENTSLGSASGSTAGCAGHSTVEPFWYSSSS